MVKKKTYDFQWQNPALLKTIYPFREDKLRDFLLYYREIDLMQTIGDTTVDRKIASELVREHKKLQFQINKSEAEKEGIAPALKELKQKHREALSSSEVRSLIYKRNNLQSKIAGLEAKLKIIARRVDWYTQFAPDHPYFEKYSKEYELEKIPYEQALTELRGTEKAYRDRMGIFDSQEKTLNQKLERLSKKIDQTNKRLGRLPRLGPNGEVSSHAAVRWLILKYEDQLLLLDQKQLLKRIFERFDQAPEKFPAWLRYMVIHFSGMRYQSAHGSWADPRDLLESLKIEELTQRNRSAAQDELDADVTKALAALQEKKKARADKKEVTKIDRQINALNNQYTRQRALLDFQIEIADEEIEKLSDDQVLDNLRAMKGELPNWVWKEIVSRTALRLEVEDENWENLTPEQMRERWAWENQRWRGIMDAWEKKDITAWRKQHERSLSLIVSRAVCNEIAEHIQHLRGLVPAAGLTAKPVWYLNSQKALPGKSYFKRPTSITDLRPGASILWLGWVPREPNAWQIAHPLSGVEVLPSTAKTAQVNRRGIVKGRGDSWKYRIEGNKFIRTSQPYITKVVNPPKVKEVKGPVIKEWLRWTHEATIIGVAEMADGDYVMTFETGKIGVNLRPLSHILRRWDVFIGYIPAADSDTGQLEGMLDRSKIFPPPAVKRPVKPDPTLAFSTPLEDQSPAEVPAADADDEGRVSSGVSVIHSWQSLTRREKQVVALICQGNSTNQAAALLDTSASNIRSHLSNAMGKFGVKYRQSLCAWLGDWDFSSLKLS